MAPKVIRTAVLEVGLDAGGFQKGAEISGSAIETWAKRTKEAFAHAASSLPSFNAMWEKTAKVISATTSSITSMVGGAGKALLGFLGSIAKKALIATAAITGIGGVFSLGHFIREGSAAIETLNLFKVSFEDLTDAAQEWVKNYKKVLGANEEATQNQLGLMFLFVKNMGVAKDEAFEMSKGLVELANDMASLRNIPVEEAFRKIQSGLSGMAMPLKQIGIVISETAVKSWAKVNGIINENHKEMTEAEKVMVRYRLLLEQTTADQGDMLRTMGSTANMLRRLGNAWLNFSSTLGMKMQAPFQSLLGWMIKVIQKGEEMVQVMDFSAMFAKMKESVKSGELWMALGDVLLTTVKSAITASANFALGVIQLISDTLRAKLIEAMHGVVGAVGGLFGGGSEGTMVGIPKGKGTGGIVFEKMKTDVEEVVLGQYTTGADKFFAAIGKAARGVFGLGSRVDPASKGPATTGSNANMGFGCETGLRPLDLLKKLFGGGRGVSFGSSGVPGQGFGSNLADLASKATAQYQADMEKSLKRLGDALGLNALMGKGAPSSMALEFESFAKRRAYMSKGGGESEVEKKIFELEKELLFAKYGATTLAGAKARQARIAEAKSIMEERGTVSTAEGIEAWKKRANEFAKRTGQRAREGVGREGARSGYYSQERQRMEEQLQLSRGDREKVIHHQQETEARRIAAYQDHMKRWSKKGSKETQKFATAISRPFIPSVGAM